MAAAAAEMLLWLLGRPLIGLVATLLASVVVLAAATGGRSPAAPPVAIAQAPGTTNVVVFLVDTLRGDHDSVTELVGRAKRTLDRQDADQPARE